MFIFGISRCFPSTKVQDLSHKKMLQNPNIYKQSLQFAQCAWSLKTEINVYIPWNQSLGSKNERDLQYNTRTSSSEKQNITEISEIVIVVACFKLNKEKIDKLWVPKPRRIENWRFLRDVACWYIGNNGSISSKITTRNCIEWLFHVLVLTNFQ
jgi:hypothetical protein